MWTRETLKSNAKEKLRLSYWKAFCISAIAAVLAGHIPRIIYIQPEKSYLSNWLNIIHFHIAKAINIPEPYTVVFSTALIAFLIVTLLKIFLTYPIMVASNKYFIDSTKNIFEPSSIISSFKSSRYLKIIKTMFVMDLFIFLWSLLLVIPGIIKAYSYRLVPYILAENPNMSTMDALRLSERLMDGYRLDTFVLDLSFIGWSILAALIPVIGYFLLFPYIDATMAELYVTLKDNGIKSGICSEEVFEFRPNFY